MPDSLSRVPRSLCYADAVTLLGGHNSRAVAALDRLTGGLLLAASAAGGGFVLSLFDAKAELARLGGELVGGLGERLRRLGRFDRSQRLLAAHAVVVVTAYFDALAEAGPPAVACPPPSRSRCWPAGRRATCGCVRWPTACCARTSRCRRRSDRTRTPSRRSATSTGACRRRCSAS
jgi:hypothetical protein